MAKRQKKKSGGVPEWVVTYGDMMSLLLCFFILLAAFSELKQDHEYQRVITAVREAFGFSGGVGVMPTDDPPLRSMLELMEELERETQTRQENQLSQSQVRGIRGKEARVSKVEDGLMFTIGGHLTFEPGSAELKPDAKRELLRVAKMLTGRRNKISIRGHCASKLLPPNSPFDDLLDLSYYRAKAVADFLADEGGLDPRVLVIEARGDTEPVEGKTHSVAAQTANRRVEVVMTETILETPGGDAVAPGTSDDAPANDAADDGATTTPGAAPYGADADHASRSSATDAAVADPADNARTQR
jgi:chemotaxis protein MotB